MSHLPHGGELMNRVVNAQHRSILLREAEALTSVTLSQRECCDVEMIADGAFLPLSGFMGEADFESVCRQMRLRDGTVWPIPVTLTVPEAVARTIAVNDRVALRDQFARLRAVLTVSEKYRHDKQLESRLVYKTEEPAHPGVAAVLAQGDFCLAGPLDVVDRNPDPEFPAHRLTPAQTRAEFAAKGWQTVAAFQTRNPIHRAHEYLTKCALEITDGLLIHPLVGETKSDDVPAEVRMKCYTALIAGYYNPDRVLLAVMPLAMRYAGPREAILHALIRKNYGATHFIVGRDHAGVGNYYGTYDAQRIFQSFGPEEIGITPLTFEHAFYCRKTQSMASLKTTNSAPDQHVALSGSKVRELLRNGKRPPEEFSRPEVADILIEWARSAR
jgi:sulfate adenylyltransferase